MQVDLKRVFKSFRGQACIWFAPLCSAIHVDIPCPTRTLTTHNFSQLFVYICRRRPTPQRPKPPTTAAFPSPELLHRFCSILCPKCMGTHCRRDTWYRLLGSTRATRTTVARRRATRTTTTTTTYLWFLDGYACNFVFMRQGQVLGAGCGLVWRVQLWNIFGLSFFFFGKSERLLRDAKI